MHAARMAVTAASLAVAVALAAGAASGGENGGIVFENRRCRAVLSARGTWRSLTDKATGRELLGEGKAAAIASASVGGKVRSAAAAAWDGKRLTVGLAGGETRLVFAVTAGQDWVLFRLASIAGPRPSRVTLLRVPVAITEHVGSRLNGAWDARTAVCLRAANMQTGGRARRRGTLAELSATTQDAPGPKLEGAAAALIVCPTGEFRGIAARLAERFGLPRNASPAAASKDLPIARQSYWFLRFGEADAEKVIDCCRRSGFRQVMMNSGSWCRTVGHYTFRKEAYPDGLASLRRTVAKLHGAGILVGMHCFASKISKTDAYVTPRPDRRFWQDRSAELAADVAPGDRSIRVAGDLREWPGSAAARQKTYEGGVAKHREVIVDDEIIAYESIGPAGRWDTFLGCRRGAWGTRAASHRASAACRHYGVDGCINGYIVDQETTLLDETTSRLAGIFNTCGFDMVYFDGGEDVDRRRFTYYVSKFQAAAMAKFRKRPLVHMGTIMTHRLWHSFTRSGTVDTYNNTIRGRIIAGGEWARLPTVREHVDRSVRYMLSVRDDMMPGELGWFGIWPKGKGTDGLQLDEIEYLMAKSLAYDAPISLQTSFRRMAAHKLTAGILEIVGAYERLRLAGGVPAATRRRLRARGKDFLLLRRGADGPVEFVEAESVAEVAGGRDVRAMLAPRGTGSVATVWHGLGRRGRLIVRARRAAARNVAGEPLAVPLAGGAAAVPVGGRRTTLYLPDAPPAEARKRLREARFEEETPKAGPT